MKAFVAICGVSLAVGGCAVVKTHEDSFALLHNSMRQALADNSLCGPIVTNGVVGGLRYFEIRPQPRGLQITVSERPYFRQREWEKRYTAGTNLLFLFMESAWTNRLIDTNQPMDAKTAQRLAGITNLFGLSDLPEWHYHGIGVDVRVQEIDVTYPGVEEDGAEAEKRHKEIVKLLRPYQRPNPE